MGSRLTARSRPWPHGTESVAERVAVVGVRHGGVRGYLSGPRVIDAGTKERMKQILSEIQSGEFAREWIAENRAGQENFLRMREEQAQSQVEETGKELRSHMDWIQTEFS